MNHQPIEKSSVLDYDGRLDVHSIFRTIQGEGPFCGTPAIFIRLAGCNLQCPMCDTDYTSRRHLLTVNQVVNRVNEARWLDSIQLVVITGGEPFRQNLSELFQALLRLGYYIQIETNGTLPPTPQVYNKETASRSGVYIVCSPKTGKINSGILKNVCALKYVARYDSISPDDGLPIQALAHSNSGQVARPPEGFEGVVYLQPADHTSTTFTPASAKRFNDLSRDAVIESCIRNGYVLQLQIHKIIGAE